MDTPAPLLQQPHAAADSRGVRAPALAGGAMAAMEADMLTGTEPMLTSVASAAVPLTKFRAPHLRRDTVQRDAVLSGAIPAALESRVLLAQAPAGFGKTTILVQLTAALAWQHGYSVVWVSLDTEDNDANRLFAAICTALAPLELPWSLPPAAWLAQLQEAGPHARAALGPLLNALAGQRGKGIVLVLDDLHHVNDPRALALLDAFIDRLPPEACLFIGSRETPALSLARWRAAGELVELGFHDLQFDAAAAAALRELRGLAQVSDEQLQSALALTHGWPAGLQLLLGHARDKGSLPSLIGPAAHRHLFDYFAQEVLADLPESLQDFVLHCSVLPELSPPLCQALTGRDDAAFVLDGLYRRQLFLSALDEVVPVLRFHDLFRDFLQRELERRQPGLSVELHARAAAAEPNTARSVQHLLAGRRWAGAIERILLSAPVLLAEGAHQTVQRWIGQLPAESLQSQPELHELLGQSAWASYDYAQADTQLKLAQHGYRARGTPSDLSRLHAVLVLRARAHNSMGQLDAAAGLLAECEGLPADEFGRLALAGARCWQTGAVALRTGFLPALRALVEAVETDSVQQRPELMALVINDLYNDFFFDVPGSLPLWRRLREVCARAASRGPVHWQVTMMASTAWPEFWHGERETVLAALDRQAAVRETLRHLPATWLDAYETRELQALLAGDFSKAAQRIERAVQAVQTPPLDGVGGSWKRPIQLRVARSLWAAQDADALQAMQVDFEPPRTAAEWPFMDGGRLLMLGRMALLRGEFARAEPLLRSAVENFATYRVTSQTGDPRISLAWLYWQRGECDAAWAELKPLWEECLQGDSIGIWLLEAPAVREPLLALIPTDWAAQPGMAALLGRLEAWNSYQLVAAGQAAGATRGGADPSGEVAKAEGRQAQRLVASPRDANEVDDDLQDQLASLSVREREVLALMAEGQSNKLIARSLELSPHTVKRHVANVLTKLALESRTQAAAVWHRR